MNRLKAFLREIHDRSLWQIVVAYAAGSWVVLQLADTVTAVLGLPDWVPQLAGVICLAALPLVLAAEVVQRATKKESYPFTDSELSAFRRWLRWRRVGALVAVAFALLATGTSGYMGMRLLGIGPPATLISQDLVEEHSQLVLADFEGAGEDSTLARAVNQGIRDEFLQSRVVTLADPRDVRPILLRMERQPGTPLEPETAREVAVRGGMPAVIEGQVLKVGEGYILRAQIVSADSARVLDTQRVASGTRPDEILDAIDRLSKRLREKIGESYRALRQSRPLPDVTTRSLEALKKYAQAFGSLDTDRRVALLEEALAIDSTFAMAWRRLGAVLSVAYREPGRMRMAYARAFEYRERLPDRERYLAEADYYDQIEGDGEKAIEAYETWLELFPDDQGFMDLAVRNNLALQYRPRRRNDLVEEVLLEALERHSPWCGGALVLINAQIDQGKVDKAEAALRQFCGDYWDHPVLARGRAALAVARGDYEGAEAQFQRMLDARGGEVNDLERRAGALFGLMAVSAVRGRVAEGEAYARNLMGTPMEATLPGEYWWTPPSLAAIQLLVRDDTLSALETVRSALTAFGAAGLDARDRPDFLLSTAQVFALAGKVTESRRILSQLEALGSPPVQGTPGAYAELNGALALAEGRYEEALAEFRTSDVGVCSICALPGLAATYEAMGQVDSVVAVYQRAIDLSYSYRLYYFDYVLLGHALERLGQLYDGRGDREKAAECYGRFVELWADADPELQPRVEAARRRLEEVRGG